MVEILDKFSAIFGLLSFILAALSIYLFLKSKKTKNPMYCIRSINLIGELYNKIDGLQINYQDKPISNVYSTNVAFWNNGKGVIHSDDISKTESIRVILPTGTILDKELVTTTSKSINFDIEQIGEDTIELSFDFLEKSDGAVINILHSSKSLKDIKLKGKIKGTKITQLYEKKGNGPKGSKRRKLTNLMFILLSYMLLGIFGIPSEELVGYTIANYSGLLAGITVLFIYIYLIYSEVDMPNKLSSYMETTGSLPKKVNE